MKKGLNGWKEEGVMEDGWRGSDWMGNCEKRNCVLENERIV